MNYVKGQFVAFPEILKLDKLKIKYTDTLIYIALRSFDGSEGCFPSYESIAERASCSRDFVIKSIKRLEKAKIITVKRSKKMRVSNHYYFPERVNALSQRWEKIPYQLFDEGLTIHEKSMLICVRQFLNTTVFRGVRASIKDLANELGMSYKQAYNPLKSLIDKGYINHRIDPKFGKTISYTDKIDWGFQLGGIVPEVKEKSKLGLLVS